MHSNSTCTFKLVSQINPILSLHRRPKSLRYQAMKFLCHWKKRVG